MGASLRHVPMWLTTWSSHSHCFEIFGHLPVPLLSSCKTRCYCWDPLPSPSPLSSQAFILEPRDPEGHMQEKKTSVSDFLVELLDHRYNLFSPTCFWTLFRACAAYFGIPSDLQEHIDHQEDKVFIQASSLACEVYVEVSPLCSLPTTVCEVADSVVCQVVMLLSFNSLWG